MHVPIHVLPWDGQDLGIFRQQANVESGYQAHIIINFSAHCLLGAVFLTKSV